MTRRPASAPAARQGETVRQMRRDLLGERRGIQQANVGQARDRFRRLGALLGHLRRRGQRQGQYGSARRPAGRAQRRQQRPQAAHVDHIHRRAQHRMEVRGQHVGVGSQQPGRPLHHLVVAICSRAPGRGIRRRRRHPGQAMWKRRPPPSERRALLPTPASRARKSLRPARPAPVPTRSAARNRHRRNERSPASGWPAVASADGSRAGGPGLADRPVAGRHVVALAGEGVFLQCHAHGIRLARAGHDIAGIALKRRHPGPAARRPAERRGRRSSHTDSMISAARCRSASGSCSCGRLARWAKRRSNSAPSPAPSN